jgi:hypothetical protein
VLRQHTPFKERAALRSAQGVRIAESLLTLLAHKRRRIRRRLRKLWRTHEGLGWLLLTSSVAGTMGFLVAYLAS